VSLFSGHTAGGHWRNKPITAALLAVNQQAVTAILLLPLIDLIIMDTESVCVANNAACIDPTRRIRHNQIAGAAY
jgi:hypothetical protein